MKIFYLSAFLLFLFSFGINTNAQNFVNGDLDGEVSAISDLPDNWEHVPHTDPVCKANSVHEATPDLTNSVGFTLVPGIKGVPYSGDSFLAGLDFGEGSHHEGIQQEVKGLKVGEKYSITFYQCVVKQENAQDTSGSWAVYADEKLLGVSTPSSGHHHWDSPDVKWERRTVTFVAAKRSQLFKFLPQDDDDGHQMDSSSNGALRMGIDMIQLQLGEVEPEIVKIDTVLKDTSNTVPVDIKEDLLAKQIDTTKLEVVELILSSDKVDTTKFKEHKEIILPKPGKLNFEVIPEMDVTVFPNPTSGIFRIIAKEKEEQKVFNLTITDMSGRIVLELKDCTPQTQVKLEDKGHFIIIVRTYDQKAVKKLIVQ